MSQDPAPVTSPESRLTKFGLLVGRAVSFLQRYLLEALPVIAAVLIGVIGDFYTLPADQRKLGQTIWTVVVFAGAAAVVGSAYAVYQSWSKDRRIRELETQVAYDDKTISDRNNRIVELRAEVDAGQERLGEAELQRIQMVRDLISAQIELLFAELGYGNDERVSVYVCDGVNFRRSGRHSESPVYGDDGGRSIYPFGEGCIGKAWAQEHSEVEKLPDSEDGLEAYVEEVAKRCNIPAETVRLIRMKSRSYAAYRLKNEHRRAAGIIVFESLAESLPKGDEVKERLPAVEDRFKSLLSQAQDAWEVAAGKGV